MQVLSIKTGVMTTIGAVGAFVLQLFGGWGDTMTALTIFMLIDILTGLAVAAYFKNSPKTTCGTLSSKTMAAGLCRKGTMLLIVLGCAQLDIILKTEYIRNMVILAFCANEFLSIIENCGLMGIKFPAFVTKAVELLQSKGDEKNVN